MLNILRMKYRGIRNYSFPSRKLIILKEYICVIGISKHEKAFLKRKHYTPIMKFYLANISLELILQEFAQEKRGCPYRTALLTYFR